MKTTSLLIVLMLLPQAGLALTLEQMQQIALENRALIKKHQSLIEKSNQDIKISKSGYYPSVDLGYNSWALDENTTTEQRENSSLTGSVSLNLFSGFRDKYSVQSAEIIKQVEETRLQATSQDIQLAVALKYLAVFNQQSRLKVAEDNYKTLKNLYLDSKNRYDVGLMDKNEVLKFKVDYDNANLAVQREKANLQKTINNLSREIMQKLVESDLDFEEFKTPPQINDKDRYEQKMLTNRSELIVLEQLVNASEKRVKALHGSYYPSIDLVGSYTNYEDSYLNGYGDISEDELRAQINLSLNLFDGFSDEAEIAGLKAETRSLSYDLAELREDMKTDLKNLFVDYEISLANVAVAKEDITYAEDNLKITQLKYKEGLQRQIDLLDAVANLTRAQSNYVAVIRTVFQNFFQIVRMVEGFSATPEPIAVTEQQ